MKLDFPSKCSSLGYANIFFTYIRVSIVFDNYCVDCKTETAEKCLKFQYLNFHIVLKLRN